MDVMLQKHGAKHVYKVPEGLRELCTDISREVLRSQPQNIYGFIAEYVDTLLITRENTKVAVKVVNNILLGSQAILSILYRSGFSLEQIAVAAPRIQKAFKEYLDAADILPIQICDANTREERSKVSIRSILEATGATYEDAERAATIIQAAFRGHYERMSINEAQGKIQWQRAVANTLDILRKAGASQAEMSKAARLVQYAYRGYYTRRNKTIDILAVLEEENEIAERRIVQPEEAIQAVAWMEMMYEDAGLSVERATEAAIIIQRAYKRYRARKAGYNVQRVESTKSMVVEAILEILRHQLFERVMSREDIPEEYGTREHMTKAGVKLQHAFKDQLRRTRISQEGRSEPGDSEGEESWEDEEETEEIETTEQPDSEYLPSESEMKSEAEHGEERSTQPETDDRQASESEAITERLPKTSELQSEPETEMEYTEELEYDEVAEESINEQKIAVEENVDRQQHEH